MTLFDRIWLADNDYYKSAVKYHNSMMVFRDGESAQIPPYVLLLGAGETERYGFSRTRVADYAGVDWDRGIVWLKEYQAFVVLDKLTARETSEYQFRARWHGVGAATLTDEGLLLEQKGPSLWVQVAAGPELRLEDDAELGGNWGGYPHAEPVVRSLSAIATVRLAQGESYLFASALHGEAGGKPEPWDIGFLAEGEGAVIDGAFGRLVIGLNSLAPGTPQGTARTDAGITISDSAGVTLLNATQASVGEALLHQSDAPESVFIERPDMGNVLSALAPRGPIPNLQTGGAAPEHEEAWRLTLSKPGEPGGSDSRCHVTRLTTALLTGAESSPALLATTEEGMLFAVDAGGEMLWARDIGCRLNDVVADDLDGDGIDELVVGRQDHHVSVLDSLGNERWKRAIEHYRRPPYVNVVRTGDLDGDGVPEVVIGGENWRFYAFKADGTELWNYESVHPSRSGAVADLDGDGKAEVVCGTHYYWMSVLNPDGTRRWRHNFGPICCDVTTGSFDGDNTRGVVCGGGDGCVHYLSSTGELRMRFDTGDEVKHVLAADLDGDGMDEIVAGSLSHNVYCLGADGQRRWRVDLGAPITALATGQADQPPTVVAGTSEGTVATLAPDGTLRALTMLGSGVCDLESLPGCVVAATDTGGLVSLKVVGGG
jgi:hypothetical protein